MEHEWPYSGTHNFRGCEGIDKEKVNEPPMEHEWPYYGTHNF